MNHVNPLIFNNALDVWELENLNLHEGINDGEEANLPSSELEENVSNDLTYDTLSSPYVSWRIEPSFEDEGYEIESFITIQAVSHFNVKDLLLYKFKTIECLKA
ncbi:hypothetical protein AMTR_s00015p00198040 [Amborella trichopoda]|uniref:Uncharacterized protein n=1 Tax=Amborella trichopoda TaxID=13333 RepID=W1PME5_AMBTC|nr:hypothetical protein AMTR_s00015p00198040 [Amborella trichopoda]